MGWIEKLLTRVEADLRLLIEGNATRDGFPLKLHRMLERELLHAVQTGTCQLPDNSITTSMRLVAPDQYTLSLPSAEAQILLTHPRELDRLVRSIESLAARSGITLARAPVLRVVADPKGGNLTILTQFCKPGMEDSSTYQLEGSLAIPKPTPNGVVPSAFLIVNGLKTFTITSTVINIGRDPCSQLQLNDLRVSRQHAQLRLVHGRFIIFDLDSQGGTFVNGVAVTSHTLNPGDVIQLGGIPLVYGQELETTASQTQELPIHSPPPEVL